MPFRVKDLLQLPAFREFRLIAGSGGLDHVITAVDTMEVPDIVPWIRENELLVTTAYCIRGDHRALEDLLRKMKSRGVAALALKTRFLGEIPQETLALADQLSLPLIQIPPQIPFVDITNPLMQALASEQNRIYQFTEEISRRFLDIQIQGHGLREMLELVRDSTGCSVFVTDEAARIVEQAPASDLAAGEFLEEKAGELFLRQEFREGEEEIRSCSCGGAQYDRMCLEIPDQVFSANYLIVIGTAGILDTICAAAVRQAASYLALELSLRERELRAQNARKAEFLEKLAERGFSSEAEAAAQAKALAWPTPPFLLSVSSLFPSGSAEDPGEDGQFSTPHLLPLFAGGLRELHPRTLLAAQDGSVVCLYPISVPAGKVKEALDNIAHTVLAQRGLRVVSAVSSPVESYLDVAFHYRTLERAIKAKWAQMDRGGALLAQDAVLSGIYSRMAELPECREFAEHILRPLKQYDAVHKTNLVKTAFYLSKNLGVQNVTAAELFLHRNSLSYRIRQIRELCHLDLTQPRDIETMLIATQVDHCAQR